MEKLNTLTYDPRRLELPVVINGVDHVVIARENNDGEQAAYVYVLTVEENARVESGAGWVYPSIKLSTDQDENCHWIAETDADGYLSDMDEAELAAYVAGRDAAFALAIADAHEQVAFLSK